MADTRTDPPRAMDKAHWLRLSPLLDELLDLGEAERAVRLAALQAEDPGLAEELVGLLGRMDTLERQAFLDTPALPRPADLAGHTVGAYTVERELGQGGMGSVWLARRTDGRYEGLVAIKFLHAGLVPRADAERFAREGRILARLAHPHIARLIDAGVASEGAQPYLVLEYVDGLPIDRHCEEHGLDLVARLRLFLDVLAAVAHAHNRLILHRDIKPTNILVTAAGEAKLLDFGIGKLLRDQSSPGVDGPTELTQRLGRAFTVQYAAPEQLRGGEVTTASDVYSLGVLLYVLLGGRHPTAEATAAPLEQMRAAMETKPRRLSEVVAREGGPRAARALRGDLDTIVAKALKKAPGERYANADALADDLRRHLAHEPIAARPDRPAYVLAKFVRRHRVGVAAGAAVMLALSGGIGVALWEAREAQRQQEQAEGLIEFMLGDLRKKLQPVGRLDVLGSVGERALTYYAAQQPGRLDAASLGRRARALHLIGEIADQRGDLTEAARVFERAAESTAALMAREPRDAQRIFDHAQSEFWVGFVAWRRGNYPQAEASFRRYLALANRLTALEPSKQEWQAEVAYAMYNLGVMQLTLAAPGAALQSFQAARIVWEMSKIPDDTRVLELATAWGWIGDALRDLGDLAGALQAQGEKARWANSLPGAETHSDAQQRVAESLREQGALLAMMGRAGDSAARFQASVDTYMNLLAADPANLDWLGQSNLARMGLLRSQKDARAGIDWTSGLAQTEADYKRLAALRAGHNQRNIVATGSLLLLRQALEPKGEVADLASFIASTHALEAEGRLMSSDENLVLAQAELKLGDTLPTEEKARARTLWRSAALRLRKAAAAGNLHATNLIGQAAWRLGATREARAVAQALQATPFRHPDFAQLQQELARSGGGAATHHP
ncbi:MAG: serine/threonine protein kinase [Vitreoscilla sp.]|nr:serine/threonine protein kinase [Vitreoscilla sp.]